MIVESEWVWVLFSILDFLNENCFVSITVIHIDALPVKNKDAVKKELGKNVHLSLFKDKYC